MPGAPVGAHRAIFCCTLMFPIRPHNHGTPSQVAFIFIPFRIPRNLQSSDGRFSDVVIQVVVITGGRCVSSPLITYAVFEVEFRP